MYNFPQVSEECQAYTKEILLVQFNDLTKRNGIGVMWCFGSLMFFAILGFIFSEHLVSLLFLAFSVFSIVTFPFIDVYFPSSTMALSILNDIIHRMI